MYLSVKGQDTYCDGGPSVFDLSHPTIVFIHGVLNDHSVWLLQSRYFAQRGYNVLALDLPGHGNSQGPAPLSVEEAAEFIINVLDAEGVQTAMLVGHSWGSLIALEAAARAGARVSHLALLGCAAPMTVSPNLLEGAQTDAANTIDLINIYSHTSGEPTNELRQQALALMQRVLASNPQTNLLYSGLAACNNYQGANAAIEKVQAKLLFIVANQDKMTPPKRAQALIAAAQNMQPHTKVVSVEAGHQMMLEAPEAVRQALEHFFQV
jgi:pimeloyl-ACP methyl ester carboxylesterase